MDRDRSIMANFRYGPATVTNAPGSTNVVINTNAWGPGSFCQAVRNLVASGGRTITFSNTTGSISLPLGLPPITAESRILGPGPKNLAFNQGVAGDAPAASRYSSSGGAGSGGGIHIDVGTVFAANCTFSNNETRGGNSGGAAVCFGRQGADAPVWAGHCISSLEPCCYRTAPWLEIAGGVEATADFMEPTTVADWGEACL